MMVLPSVMVLLSVMEPHDVMVLPGVMVRGSGRRVVTAALGLRGLDGPLVPTARRGITTVRGTMTR